jgi:FkbM family methyltransferase
MLYFDIGSNIGNWSLANLQNCDKIISLEASPTTFKRLQSNCNNTNIILLNYAVCNNNEKDIIFYEAECDVLSTINKDWLTKDTCRFYNHPYKEINCKTITIDKLIEQYGLPDLIKIDVEGGEYDCVVSLTQKVNLLCFEWASEVNEITFNCIDYLFTLGFTHFYVQNGDNYTFRPQENDFYDISTIKTRLSNTVPKQDWGMIWCK